MATNVAPQEVFAQARRCFEGMEQWLCSPEAQGKTHAELEARIKVDGFELLRELFQSHLWLRSQQEKRLTGVVGVDEQRRGHVEPSERGLTTIFGPVRVPRLSYGGRGVSDLHPADASLNLPREEASHGLRKMAAVEGCKASFEEVVKAIDSHTGAHVAKRQAEELVRRAAGDFDAFYESGTATPHSRATNDLMVMSADGKGIVVLRRDLRAGTRKAADSASHKLESRLSPGEKKNRKRMATVAAVYSVAPFIRTPEDILADLRPVRVADSKTRPKAHDKRIWASLEKAPSAVIADMFDEAERRDPDQARQWVVLVDGDPRQIECIEAEAARRNVDITIVLDLIHVLEYLWKAAWCFFDKGAKDAQVWVNERATAILEGNSSNVAAGIRRSATLKHLSDTERSGVDACCDYLINKRSYLHYDEYLAKGFPIATGVIEGACRHLIADRLDITGARWSVDGAEAVLRLRALRSSGDFDAYWDFHMSREHERNHLSRYAGAIAPLPRAA